MNIFALNDIPKIAAEQHCDKHVVKMIVEYMQLLSSAQRLLDGQERIVYVPVSNGKSSKTKKIYVLPGEVVVDGVIQNPKCYAATHQNHPCAIWARSNSENYLWLVSLLKELSREYTYRYGKIHAAEKFMSFIETTPKNIRVNSRTAFPQCMPDIYHVKNDPIAAYQAFYLGEKIRFAKWTKRDVPEWFSTAIKQKGYDVTDFTRESKFYQSEIESVEVMY
jgi:hypothetical protein